MNFRKWIWDAARASTNLPLYMSGAIQGTPPTRPFVAITLLGSPTVQGVPAEWQDVLLWVHDDPGGYATVDDTVEALRVGILAFPQVVPGFIAVEYQGKSRDLADDVWKTITRNVGFRLYAREEVS